MTDESTILSRKNNPIVVIDARSISAERVRGLDSLRFICALIVMSGHSLGMISRTVLGESSEGWRRVANALLGCAFNGPAAVIVFFVISGFCIHFPFRNGRQPNIGAFYTRRLLRIGLPAGAAIGFSAVIGYDLRLFTDGVFWSIICEIIYYLLYPALLVARRYAGWLLLIGTGYIAALIVAGTNQDAIRAANGGYASFSFLNWIVGLPCWMLGCWLAENYQRFPVIGPTRMWLLRLGVLSISAVTIQLRWHTGIVFLTNPFTLNIFALMACGWLGMEIVYFKIHKPSATLEWAGKWSYSLYLVHPFLPFLFLAIFHDFMADDTNRLRVLVFPASLLFSYLFYRAVELPAHRLAVFASRKLADSACAQDGVAV